MAGKWETPLRKQALEIFQAGVSAADPARAVRNALRLSGGNLEVAGGALPGPASTIRVVAFGKAACAMASAMEEILPPSRFPGPGIAVTSYGSARKLERFQVIEAGHPLPDANGVRGAHSIEAHLSDLGPDGLALVLISGGGSALLPSPAPGIALNDKIETTRLLLESGADINELNTVRKHLSNLKGGGLARILAPASAGALILSDVIGDDLSVIASGPLSPDPTTFGDALRILRHRGIFDRMAPAVRERLTAGARGGLPETPKPGDPLFRRIQCAIVGSNRFSLVAARARAEALGFQTEIISESLSGEARDAGSRFVQRILEIRKAGVSGRMALLAGGETTVTVRGKGRGGRNQEMALAFALQMEISSGESWVFLSAGTDGVDGPTDAAGGLVDSGTPHRIRKGGIDPPLALEENDSGTALEAAGDLVKTGPTGTNVADLAVFLAEPQFFQPKKRSSK